MSLEAVLKQNPNVRDLVEIVPQVADWRQVNMDRKYILENTFGVRAPWWRAILIPNLHTTPEAKAEILFVEDRWREYPVLMSSSEFSASLRILKGDLNNDVNDPELSIKIGEDLTRAKYANSNHWSQSDVHYFKMLFLKKINFPTENIKPLVDTAIEETGGSGQVDKALTSLYIDKYGRSNIFLIESSLEKLVYLRFLAPELFTGKDIVNSPAYREVLQSFLVIQSIGFIPDDQQISVAAFLKALAAEKLEITDTGIKVTMPAENIEASSPLPQTRRFS